MNKLEINGIENLRGFKLNGWEIYHTESNESSYFIKLRPETDWENAKHAAVIFRKDIIVDKPNPALSGKLIHTSIMYEKLSMVIHEENVLIELFKKKNDLWEGITKIIIEKGYKHYGR